MKSPILSICIPTYNRGEYLRKCLQSIEVQMIEKPHLLSSVEVVISDNHSTDTTENVVKEFMQKLDNIKYVRNEKNVGFDLNVLNVVTHATGEYCWYLGDDDIIVNGALEFMCSAFTTHRYDIICIAAEHLTVENDHLTAKKFSYDTTISTRDCNEYYFKGYCQGGFSVLMFNRAMWISLVQVESRLTWWLYYETVLRVLASSHKEMLYIKTPGVQTGQDCRWAEHGGELFTFVNSNILLEKMINFGFDKYRIEKDLNANSKKIVIIILRAKGHDLDCNFKNLKYIYKNLTYVEPLYLFLMTIIYFIPNPIIKWMRDSRKFIMTNSDKKI